MEDGDESHFNAGEGRREADPQVGGEDVFSGLDCAVAARPAGYEAGDDDLEWVFSIMCLWAWEWSFLGEGWGGLGDYCLDQCHPEEHDANTELYQIRL